MKRTRYLAPLFAAMLMTLGSTAAWAEEAASNDAGHSQGVVGKVEHALDRAAKATEHGIKRGADATAHGVEVGMNATAHGIERAATATGNALHTVANKIGGSSSSSEKQ